MRTTDRRLLSAALLIVTCLVSVQTGHAQRAAGSPPSRGLASSARPDVSQSVVPFKIQVPDAVLADLKQRLSRARFADEFPDAGWDYGTNLAYLKNLVEYWRDKYDWRTQEKRLNGFDQFKTNIDAVVIPSMPGFGFSGKPRDRGYNPERIARMWVQLMARLGYTRYSAHGSDWGNGIATRVALDDSAVVALHLAGCGGGAAPAPGASAANQTPPPAVPSVNRAVDAAHNFGYQEIQSTKPQTLGYGLSDSPVGLASWIIEKWYGWSDHDGDLEKVLTKDELLTNTMIYWVTNSGASSARIYYESRHMLGGPLPASPFVQPSGRVTIPTGCGAFPMQYDRRATPVNTNTEAARKAAEARYNIVHFATMPHGGHFPALEQPKLWVDDIRAFFHEAALAQTH